MKTSRFPSRLFAVATLLFAACFGDKVVAPDEPLPPELAVDRPRVQLFRYAMGRSVISDTVRITNNGEGPLGQVRQVGGVDYLTTTRVGWLRTEVVNVAADEALLVLWPTYAEEQQAQDDVAEITLKGAGSSGLRVVTVSARTLAGARFEFSVSPLAFAAAPGDPPSSQTNHGSKRGQRHPFHSPADRRVRGWRCWVALGSSVRGDGDGSGVRDHSRPGSPDWRRALLCGAAVQLSGERGDPGEGRSLGSSTEHRPAGAGDQRFLARFHRCERCRRSRAPADLHLESGGRTFRRAWSPGGWTGNLRSAGQRLARISASRHRGDPALRLDSRTGRR